MKKWIVCLLAVLMLFTCAALAEVEALPDPALDLGAVGTVEGNTEYAGAAYTVFTYPAPADVNAFVASYAERAAQAGYTVMDGNEGEVPALYMQAENTAAAMLLFENDALKLMIPQDMVFEAVEQVEPAAPVYDNLYVFICNQLNPSRIRTGAGSSYEMVGGANYGEMFPYAGTVIGEDGDPWYAITRKGSTQYTPAGTLGAISWNYRRACVVHLYKTPKMLDVDQDALILFRPDDASTSGDYNPTLYKAVSGDRFKCFGKTVDEFFNRQWYLVEYNGQYAFVVEYEAEID